MLLLLYCIKKSILKEDGMVLSLNLMKICLWFESYLEETNTRSDLRASEMSGESGISKISSTFPVTYDSSGFMTGNSSS